MIAYLSYRSGEVKPEQDQKAEWDIAGSCDEDRPTNNYVHQKWMSLGGGYYGLVALITLVYIEGSELYGLFLIRDELLGIIQSLDRDAVIEIVKQQIMNMVDAFVWFRFWPERIEIGNGWVWLGLSYAGYSVGRWLAVKLVK